MGRVLIGRIGRRHGLGSEFYMTAFGPVPEDLSCVFLEGNPDSPGEDSQKVGIAALKEAAGKWLVSFEDEPESPSGKYLSCEKWELDGTAFWREDLIGCEVSEPSGKKLGALTEIRDDAPQVWIIIEEESGSRISVPFLERFVRKVDTEEKKIIAVFPESVIVRDE